jgi:septal ring factor EnvC (AmiA/AmiB activator)
VIKLLSENPQLLFIIPVVALVFFFFLIQFFAQKREEQTDLSKEVALFNTGTQQVKPAGAEQGIDRLNQLEKAISSVTDSLSAQQRAIEQFHKENTTHNGEVNELKSKLRELYKEYDIILSENYSLRAKVKKLQHTDKSEQGTDEEVTVLQPQHQIQTPPPSLMSKVDMKLYEDTRTLNLAYLDDVSEVDLSDLTPPKSP